MSHTYYDDLGGSLRLRLVCNSDFSGSVNVYFETVNTSWQWHIDGDKLLSGDIDHDAICFVIEGPGRGHGYPVPICVIGRAVRLAVKTRLTESIVNHISQL